MTSNKDSLQIYFVLTKLLDLMLFYNYTFQVKVGESCDQNYCCRKHKLNICRKSCNINNHQTNDKLDYAVNS